MVQILWEIYKNMFSLEGNQVRASSNVSVRTPLPTAAMSAHFRLPVEGRLQMTPVAGGLGLSEWLPH